jgi:hypothetical protein
MPFLDSEIIAEANEFIDECLLKFKEDDDPVQSISVEIVGIAGFGFVNIIADIDGAKFEKNLIAK